MLEAVLEMSGSQPLPSLYGSHRKHCFAEETCVGAARVRKTGQMVTGLDGIM